LIAVQQRLAQPFGGGSQLAEGPLTSLLLMRLRSGPEKPAARTALTDSHRVHHLARHGPPSPRRATTIGFARWRHRWPAATAHRA
jgi:hypothetical protein